MSEAAATSSPRSVQTRQSDQATNNIDMVGRISHQITGAKLPSNRQVLQVFFYNMRIVQLTAKASAKLTMDAVLVYWRQARIPARENHRGASKLLKIYDKWEKIRKTVPDKRSAAQTTDYEQFLDSLDDLFDIATNDALDTMRIEEDKEYLILQREKGRPGCMAGADMVLFGKEQRSRERQEKEESRKQKHQESLKAGIIMRKHNFEIEIIIRFIELFS